uniref:NUDIX hydrolase n=1 Tax=Marseillevirus LCMAC102 TaxID=2506603 RepID=A0A481YU02_9VIRU|nr:MAG: hypothetical protein LCMAC102_03150 [Marseillevirus LCMAC102]
MQKYWSTHSSTTSKYKKKFKWDDSNGRHLTAGGLLPYDENGIWVIGEHQKNGTLEWTDPGGKYKFEDCDIYTTISREFCEELYHSAELTRSQVIKFASHNSPIYVNGSCNRPVYICYVIPLTELQEEGIHMNPVLFAQYRCNALRSNPDVPRDFYSSIELRHINFTELAQELYDNHKSKTSSFILSYRLKRILRHGLLATKIYKFSSEYDISEKMKNISILKKTVE